MIQKIPFFIVVILLLTACGGETTKDSNPLETEEPIKKEPFLFPFGLDFDNMKTLGQRSTCGGDCCTSIVLREIGDKRMYTYEVDCGEYGCEETHYYFIGKELIAIHTKTSDMDVANNKEIRRVRKEKTINFRDKLTYERSDTLNSESEIWIQADFKEVPFKDESRTFLDKYVDVLTPVSYTEKSRFSINGGGKVAGVVREITFYDELVGEENFIVSASNFSEIDDFKGNGIPEMASFAFSTWYVGGGEMYYGIVEDGTLKVYRRMDEESLPMQEFELYRVYDPEVRVEMPDYYIEFKENNGKSKNQLIAFTASGNALFVKYSGQSRQIELRKKKDESKGRFIKIVYDEIIYGVKTGATYVIEHTGNWDYVTYKTPSGKTFNYTIDRNKSIVGDTYRKTPSY